LSNPKVKESILIEKIRINCTKAVRSKRVIAVLDTCSINLDTYKGRITDFEGVGTIAKNRYRSSYGFFIHPLYVIDEGD